MNNVTKEKKTSKWGKLSIDLYLDNNIRRYHAATWKEKSTILNELYTASGYHKKLTWSNRF
ncbi:TPA: hypothetical protein JBE16_15640 [Legionella pneumophila subsp. pneumophila]|nr:hypothetical protein [Legionella pneumophila subsp. pneumophila]HAT8932949.1 hypothetical protein [Legionella pneumophila subsp. pneumophila]HAT9652208.1 hypothetical protein [Legionella pneumophila subsp. pneumophila]HAT9921592.1 hypothetical protein [Legionella pneumophila subsp. pneumophila]